MARALRARLVFDAVLVTVGAWDGVSALLARAGLAADGGGEPTVEGLERGSFWPSVDGGE
jgi:hypothetical protein